ncbi:MAG: hypothetical protein AAF039_09860 [Bacteroidota bacterium]
MIRKVLLIVAFATIFINHQTAAQLRPYDEPIADVDGNGVYNDNQLVDIYGNPICCEDNDFYFNLNAFTIAVIRNLYDEYRRQYNAAIERWAINQETNLKREIERQLGSRYNSFATAREAFFRRWADKSLINSTSRILASNNSQLWSQINQQERYREDIYDAQMLENYYGICTPGEGECFELLRKTVNGRTLLDMWNTDRLESYKEDLINDFGKYQRKIGDLRQERDGFLAGISKKFTKNYITNLHVNWIKNQSRQNQVLYMAAFLALNRSNIYSQGYNFGAFRMPSLFTDGQLLSEGRKNEKPLVGDYTVFATDLRINNGKWQRFYRTYWYTGWINVTPEHSAAIQRTFERIFHERYFKDLAQKDVVCTPKYNWQTVGDGWTTNLRDTGFWFTRGSVWRPAMTRFRVPDICVTIPKTRRVNGDPDDLEFISEGRATTRLNIAFNAAFRNVGQAYIRGLISTDETTVKRLIREQLNIILKAESGPKAVVTFGKCFPTVSNSKVVFCSR